jgi:hypothetical protein
MGVRETMRSWFGPSREEIWRQLSERLNARYVDGGFWKGDKVEASHGDWTITLDSYVVSTGKTTFVYTRMTAPFLNTDAFRFTIARAGFLTPIAKLFGMQDIEVGDEAFDDAFVIRSNDEDRVKTLLASGRLRTLLQELPEVHLTIKGGDKWYERRLPPEVDALEFTVMGLVKDLDKLEAMYRLLAEALDGLCRVGSAYERAPVLDA